MTLSESQALRLLTDLPEPLFIMNGDGTIMFFNRAAEQQTGYGSEEVIGKHVTLLLPQSQRRRVDVVQWLSRWADDPNPEQLRRLALSGVNKSGEERAYRVRVSAFYGGTNGGVEPPQFVVVLRDVTEEQQETANLRHDQLISNRIIAISEDAVLSIDEDHRIRFWNPAATRLFGYTEDEILGEPLSTLLPASLGPAHDAFIGEFARSKTPSKMMGERSEIFGRHKDGALIPLEASLTKTRVGDQLIMSAQVRDITARKEAEAALQESERRFRVVFDNAFEAIALLNGRGEVLELNQAAHEMLPEGEVTAGRSLWELNWWRADERLDREAAQDRLKANVDVAREGEPVRLQAGLRLDEERTRYVDFSLMPVLNDAGDVLYIIAEGRDITAIGQQ